MPFGPPLFCVAAATMAFGCFQRRKLGTTPPKAPVGFSSKNPKKARLAPSIPAANGGGPSRTSGAAVSGSVGKGGGGSSGSSGSGPVGSGSSSGAAVSGSGGKGGGSSSGTSVSGPVGSGGSSVAAVSGSVGKVSGLSDTSVSGSGGKGGGGSSGTSVPGSGGKGGNSNPLPKPPRKKAESESKATLQEESDPHALTEINTRVEQVQTHFDACFGVGMGSIPGSTSDAYKTLNGEIQKARRLIKDNLEKDKKLTEEDTDPYSKTLDKIKKRAGALSKIRDYVEQAEKACLDCTLERSKELSARERKLDKKLDKKTDQYSNITDKERKKIKNLADDVAEKRLPFDKACDAIRIARTSIDNIHSNSKGTVTEADVEPFYNALDVLDLLRKSFLMKRGQLGAFSQK